jgi:cholesterol transport system auxiliary component
MKTVCVSDPVQSSGRSAEGLSRRLMLSGSAASLAFLATGCGGGPAPVTYDLVAPRNNLRRSTGRGIIVIAEPTAVFALDSERIVVRSVRGEVTYLPAAQWTDRLPRLVQIRMIQTLENAGRAAVARPGDRLAGTFQLVVDIRAFEIREDSRMAAIELAVKIASSGSGSIKAARVFAASAPVGAIDGAGASAALDAALSQLLGELTGWIASVA